MTYQCEYLKTLLKTIDITKASSLDQLTTIFEYLGRMELVFDAEMLLEELKGSGKLVVIFIYMYMRKH